MRQQRLLRTTTSPQTVCIFCASRFLGPQRVLRTAGPRIHIRRLNTTNPSHQSTAAATASREPENGNGNGNGTSIPQSDGSYSTLTPAEQRGKEHRRQLRLAREQQLERQHIEELERRHAATEAARREAESRRAVDEEKKKEFSAFREAKERGREATAREAEARKAEERVTARGRGDDRMLFTAQNLGGQDTPDKKGGGFAHKRQRVLSFGRRDADGGREMKTQPREQNPSINVQRGQTRTRIPPGTRPADVKMPSFGAFGVQKDQSQEVSAGWGSGAVEAKPLQYAEDDETRPPRPRLNDSAPMDASQQSRRKETFADVFGGLDDVSSSSQRPRGQSRDQDLFGSGSSAYRTTPFNSANEFRKLTYDDNDPTHASSWQHLRTATRTFTPPPPAQPPPTPPRRSPFNDDPETIERSFRQHQQQRQTGGSRIRTFNSTPPSNPNIHDFEPKLPQSDGGKAFRRCARCLEVGHTARECTGPTKAVCNVCGVGGHLGFECGSGMRRGRERREGGGGGVGGVRDGVASSSFAGVVEGGGRDGDARFWGSGNKSRDGVDERAMPFSRSPSQVPRDAEVPESRKTFTPAFAGEGTTQTPDPDEAERRAKRERRGFVEDEPSLVSTLPERRERRKNRRSMDRKDDEADDEADAAREERAARKAARKAQREAEKAEKAAQVLLPDFISVSQLAQTLGVRYERLIERLERLGYDDVFPGKVLNEEVSGMIAMEYDFEPVFESASITREEDERDLKARPELLDKSLLPTRPPVVTIMGHVDHGKTTILDFLRKSSVAAGEAGGITQHIGAFSVPMAASGRTITFLDTPGHAAFLAMRQRGANVTDIVILVVAADDSVKPQTLESLRCAREAGVPILVAINKVDKEGADIQRVKQDLARNGVEIEDFGGEVQTVMVSGKTGEGMEALEEAVVTLSEILDHRAENDGEMEGWVLEATTKPHGRVATVLVKRGTLKPGQVLVAGKTWARARTLRDQNGKVVPEVGPGMPVEVDGWREQPVAGDEVLQASSEQKAGSVLEFRMEKEERERMSVDMEAINESRRLEQEKRAREKAAEAAEKKGGIDNPSSQELQQTPSAQDSDTQSIGPGQITIPFIIKADVSGSAEAVAAYIPSLISPLAAPNILLSAVGPVHESDVELAAAAQGHIIAFNLPANPEMQGQAESRGVKILENDVIYRVLDQVKEMLEAKLPPIITQRVLGEAEVSAAFEIGVGGRKKVKIAGCKVRNGVMGIRAKARVLRGQERVYDGVVASLKNVKKDVAEMRKGSECGIGFERWEGFEVGDLVQVYEVVSEKRRL